MLHSLPTPFPPTVDEIERARIRVYLNDPAGRGDQLVFSDPPHETESGPWGFRVEGETPEPRPYEPDTLEFLHWQLSSALERGKRFWARHLPLADGWVPGPVLPAVPTSGSDLNAYYDRRALHFFRDVDPKTGVIVHSGDSADIVTHEQGHAILDAIRPDLWDAPHFEVAAFHEAFGDLASIFIALAEPALAAAVDFQTKSDPARSNLVSRLAEELGAAVRGRYGADAALPGSLRDAVNSFTYVDPKSLPDAAPADSLSAEPHSFCRVMTGACWEVLVALFRAQPGGDRPAALVAAAEATALYVVAASETAPSGADFLARVARRIAREASAAGDPAAPAVAEALFGRGLLPSPEMPSEMFPDEDPAVAAPADGRPAGPELVKAIESRLPPGRGEILMRGVRASAATPRALRGRRRRDLFLHGPEYGPADGAAVEISDAFALAFDSAGFLRASRVHPAGDRDAEDARAFVRFLARRNRIAELAEPPPSSDVLAAEGKTHAVLSEEDGVRRLRRVWIA